MPPTCFTHARPCSGPKYRSAASAYSGTTPATVSTFAVPRIWSTLYGHVLPSVLNAILELRESALTFGAFSGVPSTISLPFQWNQIGTTRGVPSFHTYA